MHQHEPGVLVPTSSNCFLPSHSITQLLFLPSKGCSSSGITLQIAHVPVPVRQSFVNTCNAMLLYWGRPISSIPFRRREYDKQKQRRYVRNVGGRCIPKGGPSPRSSPSPTSPFLLLLRGAKETILPTSASRKKTRTAGVAL